MRVIVVGQDQEVIEPLIGLLAGNDFEVVRLGDGAEVLSYLKNAGCQFLVADAALLAEHGLGREVLKRCPLARLVALSAEPGRLALVDALAGGAADYFPRRPECFGEVARFMAGERERLERWQDILRSGFPVPVSEGTA
jgi:DNA-binding response OmpR family regulator